ncbi:MAG: helix-turn-helix domain-containing protein [Proteobacteria bacterium]|nr:helix-turn-helix domain-containing protein [Pseudomonadota bacterium]
MQEQPDIASVAALFGEPARAKMILALMGGRALTASELSLEAGISPATASAHLAKLTASDLVRVEKQGRHRYFQIADRRVAELVENLCGVAARDLETGVRTGPKDPALRKARVCYDHLAGEAGVRLLTGLTRRRLLALRDGHIALRESGVSFFKDFGIDVDALEKARRPTCRSCLDWSERQHHLAGGLGAALLAKLLARRWFKRDPNTRALHFSRTGAEKFERLCGPGS